MSKSIGGDLFAKLGVLSLPFPVPSFYSFSLPSHVFPPVPPLKSSCGSGSAVSFLAGSGRAL